jgi:hypothetical protein
MNNAQDLAIQNWQQFFTEFRQYGADSLSIRDSTRDSTLDNREAAEFFHQFRRQYEPFVKSGGTINVWEVAGIGKDEVRNCAVLSWLLDCHGTHGQGAAFLHCFLNSLQTVPSNTCLPRLPQAAQARAPYRTVLEKAYDEGCSDDNTPNSRVDIVIEKETFLLFIEAKVYAGETGNQIERYNRILQSRAGGRPCGLVFLTPDGRTARDESAEDVACLSWSRLADSLERFTNEQGISDGTISPQQPLWALLVQQFCGHIRRF